jgi:hypothetical protein
MKTFQEFLTEKDPTILESEWIQKAIEPSHKGFCTPLSNKKCTPRRKALAKRFKKGDIHKANVKKKKKKSK